MRWLSYVFLWLQRFLTIFILFHILTSNGTGISQVVEGDLVYNKESPPEESTSVDIAETDDGHTNSSEIDLCSEAQPEETIQSVKVCYGCGTYM